MCSWSLAVGCEQCQTYIRSCGRVAVRARGFKLESWNRDGQNNNNCVAQFFVPLHAWEFVPLLQASAEMFNLYSHWFLGGQMGRVSKGAWSKTSDCRVVVVFSKPDLQLLYPPPTSLLTPAWFLSWTVKVFSCFISSVLKSPGRTHSKGVLDCYLKCVCKPRVDVVKLQCLAGFYCVFSFVFKLCEFSINYWISCLEAVFYFPLHPLKLWGMDCV